MKDRSRKPKEGKNNVSEVFEYSHSELPNSQTPENAPQSLQEGPEFQKIATTEDKKIYIEFLFKEYERINTINLAEGNQAEQRVTFFLTITSLSIALLPMLIKDTGINPIFTAKTIFTILLLFGIVTLIRLATRTKQSEAFQVLQRKIQDEFLKQDDELIGYFNVYRGLFIKPNNEISSLFGKIRGTLPEMMILINGLLVGGLVTVCSLRILRCGHLLLGIIAALIGMGFFYGMYNVWKTKVVHAYTI